MRILAGAIDELATPAAGAQQHHLSLGDGNGELQELVSSAADRGSEPRHLGREDWIPKHGQGKPVLHRVAH